MQPAVTEEFACGGLGTQIDIRDRAQVWGSCAVLKASLGETRRYLGGGDMRLEKH